MTILIKFLLLLVRHLLLLAWHLFLVGPKECSAEKSDLYGEKLFFLIPLLVGTSATLVVTGALLVVTRS